MVSLDIATALIQVIAFFLPAWAILVQVFVRAVERVPFEKYPRTVPPIVAGVIALVILSLIQFSLAATEVVKSLSNPMMSEENGKFLRNGFVRIYYGTAAFVTLGLGTFIIALMGKLETHRFKHVLIVAACYVVVVTLVWERTGGPFRETFPVYALAPVCIIAVIDFFYIDFTSDEL